MARLSETRDTTEREKKKHKNEWAKLVWDAQLVYRSRDTEADTVRVIEAIFVDKRERSNSKV